jgi:hypothetical protein
VRWGRDRRRSVVPRTSATRPAASAARRFDVLLQQHHPGARALRPERDRHAPIRCFREPCSAGQAVPGAIP